MSDQNGLVGHMRTRPLAELPQEAEELIACLRDEKDIDLREVQELLRDCAAAVNAREETFGWSPLLFAAHHGNSKLLTVLLDAHADVRSACRHGNTALHLAARGGHVSATTLLHAKGADCEAKNTHGWTALMWSAIAGSQAVAAVLIDAAADVATEDASGRTPCMWAARHGHTGILRSFLGMGIDLSRRDNDGLTLQDHAESFRALRASLGLEGRCRSWSGGTDGSSLYWATDRGSVNLTKLLLQHGASSDTAQPEQPEAEPAAGVDLEDPLEVVTEALKASQRLLAAAKANSWEDAEAALRAGACAATRSETDSLSALDWAAIHNASAAAMTLAVASAQLEARDSLGWTALHHAVHAGSAETTSVLHYLGADFSAKSDEGDTVQHLAARADAGLMVQLLHPATPDWELQDSKGSTPLQAAAARGCLSSLGILVTLRADVNATDRQGRSVFALSVVQGHAAVVHALLEPSQPLEQLWSEEELQDILQGLPWVADEAVGTRRSSSASVRSIADSDSSSSTLGSSTRKRRRGKKQNMKSLAMHTIAEVDSEDESLSRSPSPPDERPSSRESRGSRASQASVGTIRSTHSRTGSHGGQSIRSQISNRSRSSSQGRVSSKSSQSSKAATSLGRGLTGMSNASSRASSQVTVGRAGATSIGRSLQGTSSHGHRSSRRAGSSSNCSMTSLKDWVGTRISNSPVGLMWLAGMASKKPELLPPPVSTAATLRTADNDGRAALALAAHSGQPELVAILIGLSAPIDATDTHGRTALMSAAGRGDRQSVCHLLAACANIDLRSVDGLCALDHASTTDVRRELQEQTDRNAINRQLKKSCSLPSLVKTATGTSAAEANPKTKPQPVRKIRLYLDCLPMGLPGDHLEAEVWDLLDTHGVDHALSVEVVVDPITLRSRGHAYIQFANAPEAEAAGARLRARLSSESFLRVSIQEDA